MLDGESWEQIMKLKSLLLVLMCSSNIMVRKRGYRSKVQSFRMDNLKGLLGLRGIDKMRNGRVRQKCGVKNGVIERINESVVK